MKKFFLVSVCILLKGMSIAQSIPLKHFENMNMRSIGPATTSGRVTAIDAVDQNNGTIYAGTASGGVWKSTSSGFTWSPIFDEQDVLGIGALKIAPSNPDVIWVGTGEGNPRNSQTSGKGIYMSPDGGKTWKKKGLELTRTIHRIVIDPRNENVVYAGASGSAWGPNADRGVFKTSDGGETWSKILFINDTVGCADLVMDPRNPNKLLAAMWQYGRHPWFFNSGGKGSGIHITTDAGKSWKELSEEDGLPEGDLGRIGLAIAPSDPNIVYAMIESKKTGLYKSTDGGFTWRLVTHDGVDDRPFYYSEFYVDPSNANHLIYLHSTVTESIDGGKTWTTTLPYWGVHPDHHAFWWSKRDPFFMIEGNDGGLNISHDGGRNWTFAGNLPLGQFYHVNFDMATPYNVYGGLQDNGSWKGPGYVWHEGGIIDSDWLEVMFGDGFDVAVNPAAPDYLYAMSQGGEMAYIDSKTGESLYVKPITSDSTKLRFNWNSALHVNERGVYFGSQFVHYSADQGRNWTTLSPDLTSNNKERQKGHLSGGLTTDATSAETYCTILAIASSPIDNNMIWVGTDDGQVQLTTDHGATWKNLSSRIDGLPKDAWIPFVLPGAKDKNEVFVVANNYRNNDWKPYLFHTTDGGKSWKNLVSEKTVNGHCLSIAQDPVALQLLFLGTEHGLYVSFDYGKNWERWTHDYPAVATQDLKIHPRENDLIIGTFGRAIYILDNIVPLREAAIQGQKLFENKLVAINATPSYYANMTRPRGQRFPADTYFSGENKPSGTQLTFFINEEKEKSENKNGNKNENVSKKEKVKIFVLNSAGDTLRRFSHEPDSALNVMYWTPSQDGFFWPRRKEREPDAEIGDGAALAPGKYKIIYAYKGVKDSTNVEVNFDPRLEFNEAAYKAGVAKYNRAEVLATSIDKQMEALRFMKQSLNNARASLTYVPDSLKKEFKTLSDSLDKAIGEVEKSIFGPEEESGITDQSMYVISDFYTVFGYVDNGSMMYGSNGEAAFIKAEKSVLESKQNVNTLIETIYNPWKKTVDELEHSPAKQIGKLD